MKAYWRLNSDEIKLVQGVMTKESEVKFQKLLIWL